MLILVRVIVHVRSFACSRIFSIRMHGVNYLECKLWIWMGSLFCIHYIFSSKSYLLLGQFESLNVFLPNKLLFSTVTYSAKNLGATSLMH